VAEVQVAISAAERVEDTDSVSHVGSHIGEGDRTTAKSAGGGGVGCAGWPLRLLRSLVCRVRCAARDSVAIDGAQPERCTAETVIPE